MHRKIKNLLNNRYPRIYITIILLCLIITGIMYVQNKNFVSIDNFISMGNQMAMIAIISFAVTTVVIVQCTDLSTGSNLALSAMVGAIAFRAGVPAGVSLLLVLLTGVAVGAINGILVSYFEISPFIVTFAMMSLARGIAVNISDISSVAVPSEVMLWLGR